MNFERNISSIEQLPGIAKELIESFPNIRIFLFDAQMGNGKTTFIKELCKSLGAKTHLSSPTYSIVNEYTLDHNKIYHFDLYRLKHESELFDIGFEDYLNGKNYCFIEWPQMALNYLKNEEYVMCTIDLMGTNRVLKAQKHSPSGN